MFPIQMQKVKPKKTWLLAGVGKCIQVDKSEGQRSSPRRFRDRKRRTVKENSVIEGKRNQSFKSSHIALVLSGSIFWG